MHCLFFRKGTDVSLFLMSVTSLSPKSVLWGFSVCFALLFFLKLQKQHKSDKSETFSRATFCNMTFYFYSH